MQGPTEPLPRQPRAGADPSGGPAGTGRGARDRLRTVAEATLAMISIMVLVVTGYAWTVYRALDGGLVTSDVLVGPRSPDGATDVLLVGLDSRTDARGNPLPRAVLDALNAGESDGESNTDTMILLRVPNDSDRATTAVSIPRDSYVDIPGEGRHKINSAYARAAAKERSRLAGQGVSGPDLDRRADDAGRRVLAETIGRLTGVSIDHYAEINLAGFAAITEAVGGVPVCLAAPVDDSYSGARFAAGPQRLQGSPALAFVRQRHGLPRGDLDRVVRQQAFLAGLSHEVLSAGTLADPVALGGLLATVAQYVVVDPGWDLLTFAGQVRGLTGGRIEFRTMPVGRTDLPTPSDGTAVQVDPDLVRRFFDDRAADPAPGAPGQSGPTRVPVTVDVLNASARTGLGAIVQDRLDNAGLVPGTLGNTAARRSLVSASDGADAERVAVLLGGLPTVVDPALPPGRVTVVLGRDYRGPTTVDRPGSGTGPGPAAVPGDDAPGSGPADSGPPITADGVPCVA